MFSRLLAGTLLIVASITATSLGAYTLSSGLNLSPTNTVESLYNADTRVNIARYHTVWQSVRDHYYEPARLAKWKRWEHTFDAGLTNQLVTRNAIALMLSSLKDDFSYLKEPDDKRLADALYDKEGCVVCHELADQICYIKIDSFKCKSVVREVESALQAHAQSKAFVVDLRDNPGGYVQLAFETFSLMCDQSKFASYSSRNTTQRINTELSVSNAGRLIMRNSRTQKLERRPNLIAGRPLVVLVNGETRSAAEMIAGALRDASVARVVGTRTFGKGVLQESWDLDDGSCLKLVTARYFLPKGTCINGVGLNPDVMAVQCDDACMDLQLAEAIHVVDAQLELASMKTAPSVI